MHVYVTFRIKKPKRSLYQNFYKTHIMNNLHLYINYKFKPY